MSIQSLLHKQPSKSLCSPVRRVAHLGSVGPLSQDHVVIRCSNKAGDPHIITVNCTDRLGLACDVAKAIFDFCLDIVQADFSTDGRWCFLLFWVTLRQGSAQSFQWASLKERLISECPSPLPSLVTQFSPNTCNTKKKIYLLQTCSENRLGILNDIAHTLWKLELEVLKVNALRSPDGSVVIVFLLRDIRSKMQARRQETICEHIKSVLGACHSFCELSLSTVDINETNDLEMLPGIPDELLTEDLSPHKAGDRKFSLNIDNSLSPGHTLLQMTSPDRRGLLYDCLRALSDLNVQIAYGRLMMTQTGNGVFDLLVSHANGAKLLDLDKQRSLQAHLRLDIGEPIRVMVVNKGSNMELLVATTVEKCGRSRPHILNDVTLALKMLQIGIFKVDNEKICHGERIWDLYRFLLEEEATLSLVSSRRSSYAVERVKSVLMG